MPVLFDTYPFGAQRILKNRIVMAPMTRTRTSAGDVPNVLMATYYGQRAGAGLIVTEATDVSARSNGYAWTPGIYTDAQVQGWRLVTNGVHRNGGVIFLQVWHVGRMAHTSTMPEGEAPWGVTNERAAGSEVFAHDSEGKLSFVPVSTPRQMTTAEVSALVNEFTSAFRNAKRAGFDGVEIHGANGYLFDQFMNSVLNTRTDAYGGQTPQSRTRLLLDVTDAAIRELGADNVGVRVSPFGKFNGMPAHPLTEETLLYLCEQLSRRGIAYLHLVYQLMRSGNVEDSEFTDHNLSQELVSKVRQAFSGALLWCGGFSGDSADAAVKAGWADLVAFGRPFIANPDLADRLKNGWPLADAERCAFYTRDGEKGYTDFPAFRPPR
jgi:N-ethylmaleimide reductase